MAAGMHYFIDDYLYQIDAFTRVFHNAFGWTADDLVASLILLTFY